MSEAKSKPCTACKMPIEMREGPSGRLIPMQRVRTVYVLGRNLLGEDMQSRTASDLGGDLFISHFETCSDPGRFSRKKKG